MADNAKQDKPKIIIDDDWKSQAQAEKEKLAHEVEAGKAAAPAAAPSVAPAAGAAPAAPTEEHDHAEGAEAGMHELPPASFSTLISSLVAQIFYALGGMEDPETKKRYVDLALAKHHIDTLAMLEEKTKGNLSEEEKKLLDQALYETRIHYVEIAQRL